MFKLISRRRAEVNNGDEVVNKCLALTKTAGTVPDFRLPYSYGRYGHRLGLF